ncbi:adenylyltransferase and sulfurtransferase [Terriglobus roseus]|uniref:Molybdopterin-synthase adenylyltransferase n=1 Tax=Terriglobus roseus TaxID=392734 RepID=A0A1H4KPY5_9BACT|nr:molybdopterin-synthase adenylyltransferase MoeB [Terriglobus roseus]SEB60453.1 adenylyltransferase and sulfurtransferase [Terriglobus roseus]
MTILIPTPLRAFTGQKSTVEVDAANVKEALAKLTEAHPALQQHLFGAEGKLRSFVNVYVNDDDIRDLPEKDLTPLKGSDELSIIPSIAGGNFPGIAEAALAEPLTKELPKLTNEEIARYSRHLILPEVGMDGQRKLKAAKVLCVGTGGLGAPLALYLTAAGVGTIGLVDFDVVDESNLQRQVIHSQQTVGMLKVDSAEQMLKGLNKNVNIVKHNTMLTSANALEIFKDYDVIADGTDNFQTRYLVNDACVLTGKPNAYGSIFRFEGQASVFATEEGPCYRCLYPEPPPPGLVPSCAEGGVLGILPGLVGVIQATEVIKLILGIGEPLIGRLLLVDSLAMGFRTLKLRKNPACPACGTHEIKELIDYDQFCGIQKPAEVGPLEVSAHAAVAADLQEKDGIPQISVETLKAKRDEGKAFILDVRDPHEAQIATLGAPMIPVGDLESRIGELKGRENDEILVHCRSGARSQKAALILKSHGFKNVSNVTGGILAWADKIDPSMPKY